MAEWIDEDIAIRNSPRWLTGQATPEDIARVDHLWRNLDDPHAALEAEREVQARAAWQAKEAERLARLAEKERQEAIERVARERRATEAKRQREVRERALKERRGAERKTRRLRERQQLSRDYRTYRNVKRATGSNPWAIALAIRMPVAVVPVGVVIADAMAVGDVNPLAAIAATWWAVAAFTVLAKNEDTRLFGWIWLAAPLAFTLVALVVAVPALAAASGARSSRRSR